MKHYWRAIHDSYLHRKQLLHTHKDGHSRVLHHRDGVGRGTGDERRDRFVCSGPMLRFVRRAVYEGGL